MVLTSAISTRCTTVSSARRSNGGESWFFWMMETAVVNSYILYCQTTPSPKPHLQFHRALIDALASRHITTAPPHSRPGRPRKRSHPDGSDPERLNQRLHLLVKESLQRDCVVCSKTEKRVRLCFRCKTCPDTPYLCPGKCFERYIGACTICMQSSKDAIVSILLHSSP